MSVAPVTWTSNPSPSPFTTRHPTTTPGYSELFSSISTILSLNSYPLPRTSTPPVLTSFPKCQPDTSFTLPAPPPSSPRPTPPSRASYAASMSGPASNPSAPGYPITARPPAYASWRMVKSSSTRKSLMESRWRKRTEGC
jgi:hypothetical protein